MYLLSLSASGKEDCKRLLFLTTDNLGRVVHNSFSPKVRGKSKTWRRRKKLWAVSH